MQFPKIKETDYANKGVRLLPTTPEVTPEALKSAFDEMTLDVIIPKFNAFIEKLNASIVDQATASSEVLITGKALVNYAVSLGAGNMLQEIYDTDRNGIVDDADKLGGNAPEFYQSAEDKKLQTDTKTIVGAINELKTLIAAVQSGIGYYTETYSIPAGSTTFTYEDGLLKADSVVDIYIADASMAAVKGKEISLTLADGSLTWTFDSKITAPVVVSTMRVCKAIGAPKPEENGDILTVQTYSFNYAVSGAIEPKEGE